MRTANSRWAKTPRITGSETGLAGADERLGRKTLPAKDGFTEAQRFFLAFGQIWCDNEREELKRQQIQTNPHSLAEFRVNGVVSNMPEFRQAFGCKIGQPMVRQNSCRLW